MKPRVSKTGVNVIGPSEQISLGRIFAGRHVLVEEQEPGVWLVRAIPDNEFWLHQPEAREALQRALDWARRNPLQESDHDAANGKK